MDKYESICTVGEGSYGVVLKCKDKTNGSIVAIKKFLETDNDKAVKKIATREIKILKTLRHENLVNLIEVFRRNRRIYLVFEFIEQNLLEEIERSKVGLGEVKTKEIMYQVVRGVDFMHSNNIIHRDIKPENVLINKNGLVKLCDFGFARHIAQPTEMHTDYVATRWYRSPELLVGDTKYGKPVDVWSIGVLTYEVLTSKPLFPGESDLDQLYLIMNSLGDITESMKNCFQNNQFYMNVKLPRIKNFVPLQNRLRRNSANLAKFIMDSLIIDPQKRLTSVQLLDHELFTSNHWVEDFLIKLRKLVSMHETSIYRSSVQQRMMRQSQLTRVPQQLPSQQPTINEAHEPANNHHQLMMVAGQANKAGKASNESLNQSEANSNHINANHNHHFHPMMNKVNITFNNLNTESKASFTSNITNDSNMIIKKSNPKLISDTLVVSKPQEIKNKNFLPKIDRKTPESPRLDPNGLKTNMSNPSNLSSNTATSNMTSNIYKSHPTSNPSKLSYVNLGHHQQQQVKKVSSNSIEFVNQPGSNPTTSSGSQHESALNQNTSSTTTIGNNEYTSSLQYNSLINRSNTNNTILTPTNLSDHGGSTRTNAGGVYIIDDNYRTRKSQMANNNPDVYSPPMTTAAGPNQPQFNNNKSQLREVKFNASTNLNSLRLPQVKSIEMYGKTNKNFLYENKKALLMHINNKK